MAGSRSKRRTNTLPPGRVTDKEAIEALAILRSEFFGDSEEPESGYYTLNDWTDKWKVGHITARKLIGTGVEKGTVVFKEYRTWTGSRFQKIRYYKVLPKEVKQQKPYKANRYR
jgi:hypothetical protein